VEVKIGVQHSPRELVLESALSPQEVEEAITAAIRSELGVLSLEDVKGRRVVIPVDKLSYVEVAEAERKGVGFGAGLTA
jgi:hypothetical protein